MTEAMLELEGAVLKVQDVEKTADYYREVLGFSIDWMFGDPPTQAGSRSQVIFSRTASLLSFRVNDLDGLYRNYQNSGARITASPALNVDSGQREMDVEDCDGHVLRFVEKLGAAEDAAQVMTAELEEAGEEQVCDLSAHHDATDDESAKDDTTTGNNA